MSAAEALARLRNTPRVAILVVGDAMSDVYHFGSVSRICPEAPVAIFLEEREELRPGGAANCSQQLQALGASAWDCLSHAGAIQKHRYMAGSHLVMRRDIERPVRAMESDMKAAEHSLSSGLVRALVISDYGKGWCSAKLCQRAIAAAVEQNLPIIIDPKGTDWSRYRMPEHYTQGVLCPNEQEWNHRDPNTAAYPFHLVCTMGARGILLRELCSDVDRLLPAQAHKVYDVTGAGDTVTAVIAACLATGSNLQDAARLANLAAGWTVGQVGTVQCTLDTLQELLRE